MSTPARPWYRRDLFAALLRLRDFVRHLLTRHATDDARRLRAHPELVGLEPRMMPDGRPLPLPVVYAGSGGGAPQVRAYDAEDGDLLFTRTVFESSFTGGVRVAVADFTRDGYPDVVAAAGGGPGAGPRVRVLDGKTGEQVSGPIGSFWAFEPSFDGGVHVASADVDGDTYPDVVAAAGVGGGPRVRVVSGRDGSTIADFFAYDENFRGGITVAAADLTGDGRAEIAVGAGPGGGPRVRVYDGATLAPLAGPLGSFFAFASEFGGGVFIGADGLAGDYDADGTLDLVVGTGAGVAGRVKVYSGATGDVLRDFEPFGSGMTGGVRVALAYVDDDPHADVVAGTGPGGTATIRVFSGATGDQLSGAAGEYTPFGTSTAGVYVAASNDPITVDVYKYADAPEGQSTASFAIFVYGATPYSSVTVYFSIGGTADDPDDYSPSHTASVTLPITDSGYGFEAVYIDAVDDYVADPSETVTLTITSDPAYTIGAGFAEIEITDGSSPPPPPPPPPGPPSVAITGFSDDTGASAADRLTKDTTLTVFGTATAGSTVTLFDRLTADAVPASLGSTTASGGGLWTLTYATALPEGAHELTATAAVGGDPPSPPSAPYPLVIDTTPPDVVVTIDADTYETVPLIRVTTWDLWGTPVGTVTLDADLNNDTDYLDAGETGYATAALASGTAEFTGYTPFAVGTVRVRARATDLAGNEGTSGNATADIDPSPTGEDTTDLTPTDQSVEESPDGTGTVTHEHELGVDESECGCQDSELVYSSEDAAPQVEVRAAVQSDNAKGVPDQVVGTLTWDGAVVGTVIYGTADLVPGADWEFAALSPADPAEGRHTYALDLFLDYPGTSDDVSRAVTGSTFTAGGDDGPFGAGWRLSNTDRLVDIPAAGGLPAGKLRVAGHGGWEFYEWTGSGYTGPAGTLAALGGGGYEYTGSSGTVRSFDAAGRMTGWASGDGAEEFAYAYDGSGRLATMTTPDGGVTTLAYDGSDHATTLTLPGGRVVTLTYTGSDLTRIDDPAGGVHTFAYDGDHRLLSATQAGVTTGYTYQDGMLATIDPGAGTPAEVAPALGRALADGVSGPGWGAVTDGVGAVTRRRFDAVGREVERVAADGGVWQTARDGDGDVTAVTDPLGRTTTYTLDGAGAVTRAEAPGGGVKTYTYDPTTHVLLTAKDEFGNTTTYTYDGYRLRTVTDPLGGVTTLTWDDGLVATVTNPLNEIATATYDAHRRLTGWTVGGVPSGTLLYDAAGFAAGRTDALGHTATVVNDARGRPVTTVAPTGERATVVYDAAGRVRWATDPAGVTTSYAYDGAGRRTATVEGHGTGLERRTTAVYDAAGRRVAEVDPLGRRTTWAYDGTGRVAAVTDPLGNVSRTAYDLSGNVVATIDPLGRVARYGYDAAGRSVTTTDPLGHVTSTVYDAAGRAVASINPLGHRTTTVYDAVGRVIASVDPLGNRSTTLYDADGRVSATVDPLGHRTTTVYDAAGRPEAEVDALGRRTTTVYDAAGNAIASVDALGHRTTRSYDASNRVVETVDPLGNRTTTVYEAGRVVAEVDPLGRRTTTVFDALGRHEATVNALGQRSTWVYDAVGRVIGTADPLGQRSTWVYDAVGRLVASVDPLGGRATTTYDAAGQVVATTDGLGRETRYAYKGDGLRVKVTDALGGVSTTVYDEAGRVVASVDPLGRRTTTTYDAAGRAVEVTNALGNRATTVYDAAGNAVEQIDPLGYRTTAVYDALNRPVATVDALGNRTTTAYDEVGRVVASVDPSGGRATTTFDAADRPVEAIDSLGRTTTVSYDAAGNAVEQIDPLGYRTTAVYDALNRPVATVDALGNRTTTAYDGAGRVESVTDPLGRTTTFQYDAAGRRTTTLDALEHPWATVYDAVGNEIAAVDALGRRTTVVYDALNRAVATIDPLGNRTTVVYDGVGNAVAVVNPLGHRATTAYDALDRVTATTDALGRVTTSAYDPAGSRVSLTDPLGNTTTWAYDALGRVSTETDPLGANRTFAYDPLGRLASRTDRVGRRVDFGYTAAGEKVTEAWFAAGGAATQVQTWTYDAVGRVATAADPDGTYTLSYDGLGRVTSVAEPFGLRLTFAYDATGNRTRVEDSAGGVGTVTFDAVGRQLSEELGGTGLTRVRITRGYDAAWQVVTVTREAWGAGTVGYVVAGTTTQAYDAAGWQTGITHAGPTGAALATYAYAYDAGGRLTSQTDNGATRTYTYDTTGQLTGDTGTGYSYDANGNRATTGYATGAANRTTTDGVWTYTYDAEGNVTKKSQGAAAPTWVYGYDQRNQLVTAALSATDGGTVTQRVTYAYDAWGNRIERGAWDGGSPLVERYGFDGWDPAKPTGVANEAFDAWADLNGGNSLVVRRVFGPGFDETLVRESSGGTAGWYLADQLGSVRGVTAGDGTPLTTIAYDAWGQVSSNSTPAQGDRYQFTGREIDHTTGLQYSRARVYDPATGKWLQQDPLWLTTGDPNPYRYVSNSPLQFTDPSGLQPAGDIPAAVWSQVPNQNIWRTPSPALESTKSGWHLVVPKASVKFIDDGKVGYAYNYLVLPPADVHPGKSAAILSRVDGLGIYYDSMNNKRPRIGPVICLDKDGRIETKRTGQTDYVLDIVPIIPGQFIRDIVQRGRGSGNKNYHTISNYPLKVPDLATYPMNPDAPSGSLFEKKEENDAITTYTAGKTANADWIIYTERNTRTFGFITPGEVLPKATVFLPQTKYDTYYKQMQLSPTTSVKSNATYIYVNIEGLKDVPEGLFNTYKAQLTTDLGVPPDTIAAAINAKQGGGGFASDTVGKGGDNKVRELIYLDGYKDPL